MIPVEVNLTTETQTQNSPTDEPSGASVLIEHLAQDLGRTADTNLVFAEPVDRDGITIIPVAKLRYFVGGGGGKSPTNSANGSGAGGRLRATPLGYIEVKDGVSRFINIYDPMAIARMALGGLFFTLWATAKLTKRRH